MTVGPQGGGSHIRAVGSVSRSGGVASRGVGGGGGGLTKLRHRRGSSVFEAEHGGMQVEGGEMNIVILYIYMYAYMYKSGDIYV